MRFGERPADGHINNRCARTQQVWIEELENREVDAALDGDIPGILGVQGQASGSVQGSVLGDKTGMAEIDGIGGGQNVQRPRISQNQILQSNSGDRLGVGAGVQLHRG